MPTLTSDSSGALRCGVCGFNAVAVALHEGKLSEARIVNDVPLVIACRFCASPWEQCMPMCLELAEFLDEQLKPAQHSQEAS